MTQEIEEISGSKYDNLIQSLGYPVAGCFFIDFSRAAALECSAAGGGPNIPPKGSNPTSYDLWFCRLPPNSTDAQTEALKSDLAAINVQTQTCFTGMTSGQRRRAAFWFGLPLLSAVLPVLLM